MEFKICGITRPEDIRVCENEGSAFVGFINIKRSKRFQDIEKVRELVDSMKDKEKAVLVLEPESVEEAMESIEKSGVKNIQLHSLQAEDIDKLKEINVIKAIGIPEKIDGSKKEEIESFAKVCKYLIFDSMIQGKSGGTGKQIPLEVAAEATRIAKESNKDIKLFLAGGINASRIKNEGNLIKDIFDYVDVNSGVEDSPGIKNRDKIAEFVENCKVI
ncbi:MULTISPECIES: phosphoribosylanthranilate isomerase [Methanobacterium]|jgi:phosphoribosylanthranilate isomerase|uniref:N-(5'-phosphoribosyl)anthranilate isomerase n=1 Tax=Methanobacterium veterum TaxID=408577 RepID=A0A9E4ZRP0_9EURY|nr:MULTISPECIES: phosphoribosylanthranilate isomerase [Methanobacterium]MCZ3364492.1 phosphoribosylanthranilate isomerase [Methanobacterium veterum]MCZ3372245.1 phosphoribosylanthranilate isomerase [Methanobacterium veterum]